MDVREKLVELQGIITCTNAICNFCEHFKNKSACEKHKKEVIADNMIAHGVTVQEWIPVSDPPTKQGWYHVAIKDLKTGKYRVENDLYAVETAIAHGHSVGFCKEKAWTERDKLTHWCHYPEPPKGE